ncbi:hypothetical protein E2C01_015364 [Portunus trituberculatus]|uniref:Uncharacterized protein n=1 Tax=Portunus trituberculatus TaxID=210409 RepID=A0A5B7DL58_PORTR|nr:hypothetical protein [Portunus trituberculatus]
MWCPRPLAHCLSHLRFQRQELPVYNVVWAPHSSEDQDQEQVQQSPDLQPSLLLPHFHWVHLSKGLSCGWPPRLHGPPEKHEDKYPSMTWSQVGSTVGISLGVYAEMAPHPHHLQKKLSPQAPSPPHLTHYHSQHLETSTTS